VSRQLSEIERRRRVYLGDKPPPALSNRTIIVDHDIVCLSSPSPFIAVRAHYGEFPHFTDAEVIALLAERDQPMMRAPKD
jgi:predicted phosphoribosyltransferase